MRLLVNATAFGLGSAGKAASILAELPEAEIVVYGSELGAPVFDGTAPVVARVPSGHPLEQTLERYEPDGALVVLDPTVAALLVEFGCPVAYVDSLPFLWSSPEEVPALVDVYLAQQTPALPAACWSSLRGVSNLQWTGAIVPRHRLTGTAVRAVVNLGGIASWFRTAEEISYPWVVLPPVLCALSDCGVRSVVVTTSVAAVGVVSAAADVGSALDVQVRALSHEDFIATVAETPLLVTSPGLTTLLESGRLGVPTVILPPQNLSQCLNAAAVSSVGGAARCVPWPLEVLDIDEVNSRRRRGEEAAVSYIYGAIDACRHRADVAVSLRRSVRYALRSPAGNPAIALVELLGDDGAVQAADAIRACIRPARTARQLPLITTNRKEHTRCQLKPSGPAAPSS